MLQSFKNSIEVPLKKLQKDSIALHLFAILES